MYGPILSEKFIVLRLIVVKSSLFFSYLSNSNRSCGAVLEAFPVPISVHVLSVFSVSVVFSFSSVVRTIWSVLLFPLFSEKTSYL